VEFRLPWERWGVGDPSNQVPAFLNCPNVHRSGKFPYKTIPSHLKHWDVGIIPYRQSGHD